MESLTQISELYVVESKQHKNETEESLLCIMPIDLHTSSMGLPKLTAALLKKKKKDHFKITVERACI